MRYKKGLFLTFATATRHAIHAAARLATRTHLAGATAATASTARAGVGKAERRLQRIRLARTALRRTAFATWTA